MSFSPRSPKKGILISVDKINYKVHETTGSATVIESPGAFGDVLIPRMISFRKKEYIVTKIASASFEGSKISSISFPGDSEVSEIGSNVFGLATTSTLQKIHLPAKLDVLSDDWCFMTPNLTHITVDERNKSFVVEDGMLYNEDKTVLHFVSREMDKLVLIPSVKKIAASACQYAKLEQVVFEGDEKGSLELIGRSAFFGCKLTSIKIPATVKTISDFAFNGNKGLSVVKFDDGCHLEKIGVCAFLGSNVSSAVECSSYSISRLGRECFCNNSNLRRLILVNAACVEIGRDAFKGVASDFQLIIGKDTQLKGKGIPSNVVRCSAEEIPEIMEELVRIEMQERDIQLEEDKLEKEKLLEELKEKDAKISSLEEENKNLRSKFERMRKLVAKLQKELDSD